MSISLKRLEQQKLLEHEKLRRGIRKLVSAGIDVERWLDMCEASITEMNYLAGAWPVRRPGYIYDAPPILGLGKASNNPLPEPAPGTVVIRVGPWSVRNLCVSRERFMVMDDLELHKYLYQEKLPWIRTKLTPGVYHVRMPVSNSDRRHGFASQRRLLHSGEEVASITLAAVVLLCHLKQTGNDLLNGYGTRCAEVKPNGSHYVLAIENGCVRAKDDNHVEYRWESEVGSRLWLSASRRQS